MDIGSLPLWLGTGYKSISQLHSGFFPQSETYTDGQKVWDMAGTVKMPV